MKRTMTSIALAALFACTCALASSTVRAQSEAAQPEMAAETESLETNTCPTAQVFTFGSGSSAFSFCISNHGNIQQLASPAGYYHISSLEGYIACGTGATNAYDGGDDSYSSGWNNPGAAQQPDGPHTFPLSITRKSTDGKFELKQSFDWDTTNKEITVTMVLKNLSAASITNVKLARYFNGIISGSAFPDLYDGDSDSLWGMDSNPYTGQGLMLSALSLALTHKAEVETLSDWFSSHKVCTPVAQPLPTATANDYVGRLTYSLGTISAGQSKTVKVLYKRF